MARYLLVDNNEDKTIEQIYESIRAIDPQPHIEKFSDIKSLDSYLEKISPESATLFWSFNVMILDYGQYTPNVWPEKIAKFKALNSVADVAIILISYDNTFTAAKYIRVLDIYNFIFKPFDSLILKESLNLALNIKKKAQPIEMKSQSATAFVALLKVVDMQSISELGFVTLSNSQIEVNSIAKYFSPMFMYGKKQSAWAQCMVSVPHPQKKDSFINKFQFYAAEQVLLNTIRKHINNHKSDHTSNALWNLNPPKTDIEIKMAFIAPENDDNKNLASDLERHFTNLKIEFVQLNPEEKIDKNTQPKYDYHFVLNMTTAKHEEFGALFNKECIHLLYTELAPKEDDLKALAIEYRDIYIKPLDRSYFYKKLKIHQTALKEKEQSHLLNITTHEVTKVASKVKISEISEVYVNFIYNRQLPYKDFREFVFLSEDETQVIELPAFCHYAEEIKPAKKEDPITYMHQFVFFGMSDYFLKQIRLWLLRNYIDQNKKE